jgi:hypothetical protein
MEDVRQVNDNLPFRKYCSGFSVYMDRKRITVKGINYHVVEVVWERAGDVENIL